VDFAFQNMCLDDHGRAHLAQEKISTPLLISSIGRLFFKTKENAVFISMAILNKI